MSIFTTLFALFSLAAALPDFPGKKSSNNKKGYGPHHASCRTGKVYPIDFSFAVSVSTIVEVADLTPTVHYGGYRFALPSHAVSGLLVSFLGNFDANQTTASQITTVTDSMSLVGGVSFTNASASANETTIVAMTFSSGNASSYVILDPINATRHANQITI